MIDKVESRHAEFESTLLRKCDPLGHSNVIVLISRITQRRMRARSVAECKIGRLVESRRIEPQNRTRVTHVRIHPWCYVDTQRLRYSACVIELRAEIDRVAARNHD